MSRGNTGTNFAVTTGSFKFFDMLPKRVRVALANSNHNWCPEETYDALSFELEEPQMIQRIYSYDRDLAAQHYALLASGRPYPRG